MEPGDIWAALRRNWGKLIIGLVLGCLLGMGVAMLMPRSYYAEGLLVIETQELGIPELATVRSSRTVEPWGGRSEARILTSRELVDKAVVELGLQFDDRYNPTLHPTILEMMRQADWLPIWLRRSLSGLAPDPRVDQSMISEIVENIQKDLSANSEQQSYAITLGYTGKDPVISANLVNTLMKLYIDQEVSAKMRANEKASTQLKARVDELGAELEQRRQAIRSLESETSLVQGTGGSFRSQELTGIADERRRIEAERSAAERDLKQIDAALAQSRLSLLNPELITPRLRSLWTSEAELERTMAERSSELGPLHPQMVSLRNEIESTRAEIRQEVISLRQGVADKSALLKAREASLEQQIANAEGAAATSAKGRALADQLKEEVESTQALYDLYRNRYEQTVANIDLFAADARVVSTAAIPQRPSSPGVLFLGIVGAVIGTITGAAAIILRHWTRGGLGSPDETSMLAGFPTMGALPVVGGRFGFGKKIHQRIINDTGSVLCETIRGILFRIQHSEAGGRPPKVVMLTSPLPRDGKSSLTVALARVAAEDGLRCLALDCDFRRPSIAQTLGIRPSLCLNDFMDGLVELEDVLIRDRVSRAHFIPAKAVQRCSRSFLERRRLRRLIQAARQHYDLILIDTPPVMKVIDPMILSSLADASVLVVSWTSVTRGSLQESVRRLESAGSSIIGVIMTHVSGQLKDSYVYGGYDTNEAYH
ncbi:MAG: polysaccharide biosynthesis tyrosine autokinase [Geminicoccaceae bacterium]|nr:polysaccharide biosynthesis tyrosine autokinase [Geminicoccaceae bacterium]